MIIKFKEWECIAHFSKYTENNRVAITLVDSMDGSPIAKATVNIGEAPLKDDEVIIKGWSENEGMQDALIEAGIIGPEINVITNGITSATIHKVLNTN
jgi:hypothetical protein